MDKTLKDVKEFNEKLKASLSDKVFDDVSSPTSEDSAVPDIAPGVHEDMARQRGKIIDLSCVFPPRYPLTAVSSKGNMEMSFVDDNVEDSKEAKRQKLQEEEVAVVDPASQP